MEGKALMEYLDIVADMEENLFLMEKLEQAFSAEIAVLGYKRDIPEPVARVPELVQTPEPSGNIWRIGAVIGVVLGVIIDIAAPTTGMILLCGGLGTVIGAVAGRRRQSALERQTAAENAARRAQCDREFALAKEKQLRLTREDEERVRREEQQKLALVRQQEKLAWRRVESRDRLDQIYSANVIFPKYRNMAAIFMIRESLAAGRSKSLGEAYDLFEQEKDTQRVLTKMDPIVAALGEQARQLQEESGLTAYHTQRIQRELQYLDRMKDLTGKNDGPFFGLPPT